MFSAPLLDAKHSGADSCAAHLLVWMLNTLPAKQIMRNEGQARCHDRSGQRHATRASCGPAPLRQHPTLMERQAGREEKRRMLGAETPAREDTCVHACTPGPHLRCNAPPER